MHIPNALYDVINLVHRALRSAPGPVSICQIATFHAQHHAIVYHAIKDAPKSYRADTNAQEYVAKTVLMNTANYARLTEKLESIFSR